MIQAISRTGAFPGLRALGKCDTGILPVILFFFTAWKAVSL